MRILLIFILLSTYSYSQNCDSVPPLNQEIVDLASAKMKKKVGRGECWDLAKYVLDETGAVWDKWEVYGKLVRYKKECLMPGDIIQFENIKLEWEEGNMTYKETMKHHTAIIYEVVSKDEVILIHQNTGQHGRKVGTSSFRIDAIKKGKIIVYRPVAE